MSSAWSVARPETLLDGSRRCAPAPETEDTKQRLYRTLAQQPDVTTGLAKQNPGRLIDSRESYRDGSEVLAQPYVGTME